MSTLLPYALLPNVRLPDELPPNALLQNARLPDEYPRTCFFRMLDFLMRFFRMRFFQSCDFRTSYFQTRDFRASFLRTRFFRTLDFRMRFFRTLDFWTLRTRFFRPAAVLAPASSLCNRRLRLRTFCRDRCRTLDLSPRLPPACRFIRQARDRHHIHRPKIPNNRRIFANSGAVLPPIFMYNG